MTKYGIKRACIAIAVLFAVNIAVITLAQRADEASYKRGSTGSVVSEIQQKLKDWGYYSANVDGVYGSATRSAVLAAQGFFRLPQTGTVDLVTWDEIYDQFAGIENASLRDLERFPYTSAVINQTLPRNRYSRTSAMTQFPGYDLSMNNQDAARQEVVR